MFGVSVTGQTIQMFNKNTPSLLKSILRGYIWIILLLTLGTTSIIFTTFRTAFRERAMEDLTRSAYALVPTIQYNLLDTTNSTLDSVIDTAALNMNTRITVIGRDGSVIADSEKDPEEMENHRTRVEVIAAFNGIPGHSVRYSETLGREMLYTAVPVIIEDSITTVVRTSLFFDSYSAAISPIVKEMFFIMVIALAIATLSGWIISKKIAHPMSNLADVADRVRAGHLGARAAPGHTREHNSLASSLNETLAKNEKLIKDLLLSNSRSQAILQSMVEGIAVVSKDKTLLLINESFKNIFNIRNSEKEVPVELTALLTQSEVSIKGMLKFEDKIIAYLQAPVENSEDSVFSFRDVSKEVQLSEMKKNFVSNVSHELRTPLTAIKGYAETLQEEIQGEANRYLNVILRNTDRLIALVKDIQTLSEVESGADFLRVESFSVSEIFETVMPLFTTRSKDKDIPITLVQTKKQINITADRYRIEQVFINLIDNALKYSDTGSIEVRASTRGKLAVFAVSDTGRGIPKEAIPRIFERFFVVDPSRSRKMGGTGLGLAITKHIIEAHGGTISVSSTMGQGSIFLFTITLSN